MRRRGFTVIELLVVIGIILILVTMLFVAYSHVTAKTRERDTKTALQTAVTLLSNYEQATHFNRPLPNLGIKTNTTIQVAWGATSTDTPTSAQIVSNWTAPDIKPFGSAPSQAENGVNLLQFWTKGLISGPGAPNALGEQAAPAVSADALNADVSNMLGLPQQVVDTICVMYALESLPENQTIIANLPTNQKFPVTIRFAAGGPPTTVSLLLDGWGNPILFVPGNGLYGVMTSTDRTWLSGTNYSQGDQVIYRDPSCDPSADPGNTKNHALYIYTVINAAGVSATAPLYPPPVPKPSYGQPAYANFMPTPLNTADVNWGGLCAPGLRPFWVSAGPDGDVSNARGDPPNWKSTVKDDDNIYSFQ